MTPRGARLLRGGLLAVVAVVAVVVGVLLVRRPARNPPPRPVAPEGPAEASPVARSEDVVLRGFSGGEESYVLRARRMAGQQGEEMLLEDVELTFSYAAQGRRDSATIRADRCSHRQAQQRATFRGNVVVRTGDGLELKSDSLFYRGDKQLARTDSRVAFVRKDVSGTAEGALYDAENGRVELLKDVVVAIRDPDVPPADIRSARAEVSKEEGLLTFGGGVEIVNGTDTLRAGRLEVRFGPDLVVSRAQAVGDVDLNTSGGLPGAPGAPAAGGLRRIVARRLEVAYQEGGRRVLKEMLAGPEARLTAVSGPGEPPERRELGARFLSFFFDGEGRLVELQAQKEASFRGEPVPPAKGTPRTLTCQSFTARFDPATGAPAGVEFNRDVVFRQGSRRATADRALFEGPQTTLHLRRRPELRDEEAGSELRAALIDLHTDTGDLEAREAVRHVVRRKGASDRPLLSGEQPALLTAGAFDYDAAGRRARYREGALLRSGRDEIRAAEIVVHEGARGQWRLEASGEVVTVLHPRPAGKGGAPAPIRGRAGRFEYDEAAREMAYRDQATLEQGEMGTRSPEAVVKLTPEGQMESLVAGDPVEVRHGPRLAKGSKAIFRPLLDTLEVAGEGATLKEPGREVEGRSLVLHLKEDRLTVDGEEQGRTDTVIRRGSGT